MTLPLIRTRFPDLPDCPPGQRAVFGGLPFDPALHLRARDALPLFHGVERSLAPSRTDAPERIRVGAWNMERCAHAPASSALLAREGIEVALLTEVDVGMARTGQRHTPRDMVGPLGHECLYAVEFLELSLGSAREETLFAGQINRRGFHGNALSAAFPLRDPVLIRFDDLPTWFPEDCDERRIGGRMALAARMDLAGGEIVLVSAHLEIRVPSDVRAHHMAALLGAVDAYAPGAPVLLGGDFNTDSDARTLGRGVELGSVEWARVNDRTQDPVAHEPLFEVAAAHGYDWRAANWPGRTTRETPQSGPRRYPDLRLDWFFTRGLVPRDPGTVPALGPDGTALSDHDLITVEIGLS